jgi:hypothetical protein
MADNTTLYIIIGIVLLFALMNANAQPSAAGAPAMSAYLRRRKVALPEFIEIQNKTPMAYIQTNQTMPPAYLRGTLSSSRKEGFTQGLKLV